MKTWTIYMWVCSITNKVYIGQTCKTKVQYRSGKEGSGYIKRNPDSHFARAIKKYGWENFKLVILEENIPTIEKANERETYWITTYDSVNNGYNANYGGNAIGNCSNETREKLSNKSKEMWNNNREDLLNIFQSKEHRNKLSNSIKSYYENNPKRKQIISNYRKNLRNVCNEFEIKTVKEENLEEYYRQGYQPGKVFINKEIEINLIKDYVELKLCIKELVEKYRLDRRVIERFLEFKKIELDSSRGLKSQSKKLKGRPFTEEHKQKISLSNKKSKGKINVYKDNITKQIYPEELAIYLNLGYKQGRAPLKNSRKVIWVEKYIIFESRAIAERELPNFGFSKNAVTDALKHRYNPRGQHIVYLEEYLENKNFYDQYIKKD